MQTALTTLAACEWVAGVPDGRPRPADAASGQAAPQLADSGNSADHDSTAADAMLPAQTRDASAPDAEADATLSRDAGGAETETDAAVTQDASAPETESDAAPITPTEGTLTIGSLHACVLRGDAGQIGCWGLSSNGQLGRGEIEPFGNQPSSEKPVLTTPEIELANATVVAAGDIFTCALVTSGIRCWGDNYQRQLGMPGEAVAYPQRIIAPPWVTSGVLSLAVGGRHACARSSEGSLNCWGANDFGQAGPRDVTKTTISHPSPISELSRSNHVALGRDHSCAVDKLGRVVCWGRNDSHQCGLAPSLSCSGTDCVRAPFVTGVAAIKLGLGDAHSCALTALGTVRCWGRNLYGEAGGFPSPDCDLRAPDVACAAAPTTVPILSHAVGIAVGSTHSCALRDDGSVWCWGSNVVGELGNGTADKTPRPTPVRVLRAANTPLDAVVEIAAWGRLTCARTADGRVPCWGSHAQIQGGVFAR